MADSNPSDVKVTKDSGSKDDKRNDPNDPRNVEQVASDGSTFTQPNKAAEPRPYYIVAGGSGVERVNLDDWQTLKEDSSVRFATPTEQNQWHADNPDADGVDLTPSEAV